MARSKNEKNKRDAARLVRKLEKKANKGPGLFARLFGGKDTYDAMKEEKVQSPWRTIIRNFLSNRVSMVAMIVFICVFAFVVIGPRFFVLDLSYQEPMQQNMPPSSTLMKYPQALADEGIEKISVGAKFSVGVSKAGNYYFWGEPKISATIFLDEVPQFEGNVVDASAGYDHIVVLTDAGEVVAWGNGRNGQLALPDDLYNYGNIIQIEAGYQVTAVLTDQGYVLYWGNLNLNDINVSKNDQYTIKKIALTSESLMGLTFDGEVVHLGKQGLSYSSIPAELKSGVTDIGTSGSSVAAIKDGKLTVWGTLAANWSQASNRAMGEIPEYTGNVTAVDGGRYHYTATTDTGETISWGSNIFGQLDVPDSVKNGEVEEFFTGYYQNYAKMADGSIKTWGLKGYTLGTDTLGRDVLNRMVNGGRMTMSIGFVSVIISLVIGVIIGCLSGFFGGKVDMLLMRLTEIFSAIPFLPFAMILSSVLVTTVGEDMRIFIIMIILGVLSWTGLARLVRAQVLSQREQEYVTAAKAMGIKEGQIVFRHILPNVISTIIVNATLSFATCLLTESSLSYLGFGVTLPRPTWGNMLYGANNSIIIREYWWQWVFPALILSVCVICINTIGDGLRDAIDPKSNDR